MFSCVLVAPLVFYDFMFVLHKQTSSSLQRIYWTPATTNFGFKQTKTELQSPRLHLASDETLQMLFIYIGKNKGPKIDPCGTPQFIFSREEAKLLNCTN